jgi:1-acylglycerone phosphate reductase
MASNTKQSVLITGYSGGGIGDALAQEFHSRGFLVFAIARNLAKIQHLKELGYETLVFDVTDEKSIEQAVRYISEKTGSLHYLINNAGMGKITNRPLQSPNGSIQDYIF